MKTITRITSFVLVAVLLTVGLFGCYGNMTLTKKLYDFNGSINNRYMQQIAFWVMNIVPLYSAAHFVVFLNTIEFWTGSNPMAMKAGEEQIRYTRNGDKLLQIKSVRNNMFITETEGPEAGTTIQISYDPATASFYLISDQGTEKIAALNGSKLNLLQPNGQELALNIVR